MTEPNYDESWARGLSGRELATAALRIADENGARNPARGTLAQQRQSVLIEISRRLHADEGTGRDRRLFLSDPSEDGDETLYTVFADRADGPAVLGLIVAGSSVRVISWPGGEEAVEVGGAVIPDV